MTQVNPARHHSEGLAGLLLSLLMAAAFVGSFFGIDFVLGRSVFWQTEVRDVTQYVAGFNFYFTAPWQSPWLAFNALNYPEGTLATFVDAIPLYALLLKLAAPDHWAPFNPYGVWVALCFALQATGAWWLAKELKTRSWAFLMALVLLLLSFPALLDRIGHISLMSHWLLLFALALYLRSRNSSEWPLLAWTLLCLGAFYINIYLFVMVGCVWVSALLNASQHSMAKRAKALALPALCVMATAWMALWPLPSGKPTPEFGFGYYALNLLSPWVGGHILPAANDLGLNPIAGFTYVGGPGHYEGFNYLGLGVLLLLSLGAWRMVKSAMHHKALIALMLMFAAYALSDHVMLGQKIAFEFKYPEALLPLTSQFRASGRFFWLVGYALLIFSLYHCHQMFPKRHFAGLVVLVCGLQWVDLQGVYQGLSFRLNRQDAPVMDAAKWDEALGTNTRIVYAYPKFKCGKDPQNALLPLMKYTSERHLKLNTGYIARYTPDCQDMKLEIAQSNPANSAYVLSGDALAANFKLDSIFPSAWQVVCKPIDFAQVCRATSLKATP